MTFEQMMSLNYAAGAADYSNQIVHYTAEESLYRILEGNELWFGRIDQMNDASEYDHYWNAVERVITELAPDLPPELLRLGLAETDKLIRNSAYISSWCEYFDETPEGSLQMWRAYGDAGRGVAAVIDSSKLQPSALTANKFNFFVNSSKVQYVRTDDVRRTSEQLLVKIRESGVLENIPNAAVALGAMLAAKAPTSKHHSFREEQEIRFLALPAFAGAANRFFPENCMREVVSNNGNKFFFAMPLVKWDQFDFDLRLSTVLRKILIGPLNDPTKRRDRVRERLDRQGLQHVSTEIVDIPLRE